VEEEGSIIETIECDRLICYGHCKVGEKERLKKVTSKRRRRRNSRTKRRRRGMKEIQVTEEADGAFERSENYEATSDDVRAHVCTRIESNLIIVCT
jgi:hypothetical protein